MKDKIRQLGAKLGTMVPEDSKIRQLPAKVWAAFSRNIGLKLLSLAFAMLLWSYVITSNPSITRTKSVTGLSAYINGQATLNAYRLALASDPGNALSGVSVTLEVPQSEYAFVSQDNVQVSLDLTSVRAAGTQSVALRADTSYGKVLRIIPDALTLTFESLDSRSVPVNVTLAGAEQDGLWYNKSRVNPQQLTISGAASTVQRISSAEVVVDVTDHTSTYTTAAEYVLYDSDGNEIPQAMLNCSASSITVGVDIYPTRELAISNLESDVIAGQVAEGYEIESISIQPETVIVAAEQDLLDSLDVLHVEPISVYNASQSFSRRVELVPLAGIKYTSVEQAYVSVNISEETVTARIEDVNLVFIGKDDSLALTWQREPFSVRVTGPKSRVEELQEEGLSATADLSDLSEGEYNLPLVLSTEDYPDLTFELEPETVSVTLESQGAQD